MSDFEQWFRSLNANGKTVYFLGNEHKVSEMAWNHQQAKINELQRRVDYASQEVKGLERFTGEDCIADFEVLQGVVSHACRRLEKALRGGHE